MATKGLWRLEGRSGLYRFAAAFILLMATAVLAVFAYDYVIDMLKGDLPKFVNVDPAVYTNYQFYIWSQWFGKNLYQTVTMVSIIFGATMITGERSRNTLQFVLSKPLSRTELLKVKYVITYLSVALAVILSTAIMYLLILATGRTVSVLWMLQSTVLVLAGVALLIAVAGYFSVLLDNTLKAFAGTALVVFLLSVPGVIPGWQQFSLFYQMKGVSLMAGHSFPVLPFLLMVAVAGGVCFLANQKFSKQDL